MRLPGGRIKNDHGGPQKRPRMDTSDPARVARSARPEGARAPRDWLSAIELIALGAIWGASFLFMRVAAPEFGPLALVEVRLVFGTLVLAPLLWRARAQLTRTHWRRFALVGALSSALPFVLFAWAAERAPAGIGAIANSLTVLFTALVAFVAFGEPIGTRRMIALIAGFVGVVVLASGRTAGADIGLAALAGTVASLCYGVAANLLKRWFAGLAPGAVAAGTLVCSTIMVAPFAATAWPDAAVGFAPWASAIALGFHCNRFAYSKYLRLNYRIGATRASTSTYLVPLFGVGWAWLLLDEPLTPTMAISGALILGSVILSQRNHPSRQSGAA
jgi:drug/metabolite transporter (DMT)-like permease